MSSIAIYVEGGGDGRNGRAALRRGMNAFLDEQKQAAQGLGWRWKLACAGSRNDAFSAFSNATARGDWVVADGDALANYYGQGFRRNALPDATDLESVPKRDIEQSLRAATSETTKGTYHKIRHASALLARISPRRVRERCEGCRRLWTTWPIHWCAD